jgi:hypothetical protein
MVVAVVFRFFDLQVHRRVVVVFVHALQLTFWSSHGEFGRQRSIYNPFAVRGSMRWRWRWWWWWRVEIIASLVYAATG